MQLADALGHQFAKDDGHKGDHRDHNGGGRDGRRFVTGAQLAKPIRHAVTEGRLANNELLYWAFDYH